MKSKTANNTKEADSLQAVDMPDGRKHETPTSHEEYAVGGGWGNAIHWSGDDQFSKPFDETRRFRCHGWKRRKPQVGDTLRGEFQRSIIWFRFVKVKPCGDPPDMFFAEVVAVRQEKRVGHIA